MTLPKIVRRSQLLKLSRAKLRQVMHTSPSRLLRCRAYGLLLARRARPLLLICALLLPTYALAQTCTPPPSPGPSWVLQDCGWLPSGHPAIRRTADNPVDCATATPYSTPSVRELCRVPDVTTACSHLNPYSQQDALVACIAEMDRTATPAPRQTPLTFVFGDIYVLAPYHTKHAIVVGKAMGLDGVEVVTFQIIEPVAERGTPVAVLNDGGTGAKRWTRLER